MPDLTKTQSEYERYLINSIADLARVTDDLRDTQFGHAHNLRHEARRLSEISASITAIVHALDLLRDLQSGR
jgi:hypothetical protein